MEDHGIFNPGDEADIWSLHFVFMKEINYCLFRWLEAWIRHPLRTEHNSTPLQLWINGKRWNQNAALPHENIDWETYGIDWTGFVPAELEVEASTVEVPENIFSTNAEVINELNTILREVIDTNGDVIEQYYV